MKEQLMCVKFSRRERFALQKEKIMKNEKNEIKSDSPQDLWLSVVIPIYNAEKFLRRCLDSIRKQSDTDFEVLLIDDGSTDASASICQNYSQNDNRFRYIRKQNGGAYQSRIFGAERACGTYITFCDADDFYLSKDAFACLHEEIVKTKCAVLQFGYVKKYHHLSRKVVSVKVAMDIDENDFLKYEYPKLLCSFWEESRLTTNVWNKVYHRKLFSDFSASDLEEKIFWGDDQILNLQVLSKCDSFRFIPNILYCYRQLSGGTNRFSMQAMKDLDKIKEYQLLYLKTYSGKEKERIKGILFSELAGWFFIYIQQALDYLDEDKLLALIEETLNYPSFVLAREYYMDTREENWEAANLLRKADAHEYIAKARQYHDRGRIKRKLREIVRKIV